jgi:hypothetical protein
MAQQKMIPTNGVVALRKMVCLQTNSKKGRCAMGLLGKKIIKEIRDGTWRHLVNKHNIDVDTISKELRCVEREGVLNGGEPVTFLRVFKPAEAKQRVKYQIRPASLRSDRVATMDRNRWLLSIGTAGYNESEQVATISRKQNRHRGLGIPVPCLFLE